MLDFNVNNVNSNHITNDLTEIPEYQINQICDIFKKSELDNIISESKKVSHLLSSIEAKKDKLFANISQYDPKAIHLAHQHLAVIQTNLQEQFSELRTLINHLEKNHIVELEEGNRYLKMRSDQDHFHRVFRLFLPYILICSIYLKIHEKRKCEEENKKRE
jgi:hypothetical protein